jgi:hypothetical protein
MSRKVLSILPFLFALLALSAAVQTGAQPRAQRTPVVETRSAARAWDGQIRGRQIETPVELAFGDATDYDNFAAGRLPVQFVLRNTISAQTIRLDPETVRKTFRRSEDKSSVVFLIVIDNLSGPLWDAQGCTDVRTGTEKNDDGTGIVITMSYAPCAGATAMKNNNPIPGIGIVIKKNPGGGAAKLMITTGGTDASEGSERRLRERLAGTKAKNMIVVSSSKGTGSPKAQGF